MNDLKKCPFCGGRPHFEDYGKYGRWGVKHTCKGGTGNDRRIGIYASGFDTKQEAVDAWNARAEAQGHWEIIVDDYDCEMMLCSVCKSEFYDGDNDTVDQLPNYCPNCGAEMRCGDGK